MSESSVVAGCVLFFDKSLGGGQGGHGPPFFSCIFEKFLTLSLTFGHKCSQNDVKQHHQFVRPPLSGFSGSAPDGRVSFIFPCSLANPFKMATEQLEDSSSSIWNATTKKNSIKKIDPYGIKPQRLLSSISFRRVYILRYLINSIIIINRTKSFFLFHLC